MKTIFDLISFRGNYFTAIFLYLGLGLFLLGITPDLPSVHATDGCGGEAVCPAGYICCNGECCLGTTCPCCNENASN
jgi:hypothetical protein